MNEFEIDKRQVRRSFSRAAKQYDAAAVLQREVCSRMLERLPYIKRQPARPPAAAGGQRRGADMVQPHRAMVQRSARNICGNASRAESGGAVDVFHLRAGYT